MNLILTVIKDPSGANMLKHTKAFVQSGGSFGRGDSNDWVLPDVARFLSSCHARLEYIDHRYLLKDLSTNGTYINNSEQPVGDSDYPLQDGDIIRAGEYRLKVSLRNPTPNIKNVIPDGLGDAEFLDGVDHTKINSGSEALSDAVAKVNELDKWLDTALPKSSNIGWGNVATNQSPKASDPISTLDSGPKITKPLSSNDPLALLAGDENTGSELGLKGSHSNVQSDLARVNTPTSIKDEPESGSILNSIISKSSSDIGFTQNPQSEYSADPFISNDHDNGAAGKSNSDWAEDDNWWKDGSHADHTPADQHVMPHRTLVNSSASEIPTGSYVEPKQNLDQTTTENIAQAQEAPFQSKSTNIDEAFSIQNKAPAQKQNEFQTIDNEDIANSPNSAINANELASQLGLDNLSQEQLQELIPETAGMINETLSRLIDLLRARSSLKNELRTDRTMISSVDNNPLKFSATTKDALRTMFSKNSSAFLSPKASIQSSFNDLSDHQVAVLSGMRAAYEAMLDHFSPQNLKKFINANRGFLKSKSAHNWEAYLEYHEALMRDQETTYNKLFGDEFAQTYEKQLSELKNARSLSNDD